MIKSIIYMILLIGMVISITSCSDMNDKHEMYLAEGERIYIGKIDSLKTFTGNERIKLRFWASDPRAKKVAFYWVPGKDSVVYELNKTSPVDSFEVFIGGTGSEKTISEGNYTLKVITRDNSGNFSIPFEKIFNVYGDRFRSTLTNRILKSVSFQNTTGLLTLNFSGPVNDKEKGIELSYTTNANESKKINFSAAELVSAVSLPNVDPKKPVSYRTAYLPEPSALDTFYTQTYKVEISEILNVALNKNVTASSILNESFPARNAVDGLITNESRWVSIASGIHWIEIDLGQEYEVHSFKTWVGSGGSFNYPIANFMFQAYLNGGWENIVSVTNNSNAQYEASFTPVKTSRVRYYVPEYSGNQVRLYDIAVYAKIKY